MCHFYTLFLSAVMASAAPDAAAGPPQESRITFESHVAPFVAQYCTKCHGGEKPEADLALDAYRDAASVRKDRESWETVLEMLQLRSMPPEKEPQPTKAEVRRITAWIEAQLAEPDGAGPGRLGRPGGVTLRRLNRAEYNNTIRDLVGVDFRPADDFPSDDVGYGFDNIGDVLSLSPLLMEKYLAAADQIVRRAFVTPREPTTMRFEPAALKGGSGDEVRALYSVGDITAMVEFPHDGEYVLRAQAYADQAGPEPARMAFRIDSREIHAVDVQGTKDAPQICEARFDVESGSRGFSVRFLNDYFMPDDLDPSQRDRNLYVKYLEVEGPFHPPDLPRAQELIFSCEHPERTEHDRDCANRVLRRFASRAYRRPVTADELNRLLGLVDLATAQGDSVEEGMQLALQAVLVSPHFLFRVELETKPDGHDADLPRPVTDYEMASRLSYFLWSSMPDETLFELAEKGTLGDKEALEAQVRRMLAHPGSRALVGNFAGQWLNLRSLARIVPDPELFPEFDEDLRSAMLQETSLFFEAVMREDLSILTLLDARFTFLNERLARHYEIPDVAGNDFRRVKLETDERGGVLTHASILTLTSNPTRTSPVKRGKWILENILGTPPPPPLPGVAELSDDKAARLSSSLRQRMEQHRSKPTCASCHSSMDPLGFAFENFDAVGAWRDADGKFPIDASGSLPSGESFNGPGELRTMLGNERRDEFTRALSEKMLTYALGRGLEYYDKPAVDEIAAAVAANDDRFSSLVLAVVNSAPFRMHGSSGVGP